MKDGECECLCTREHGNMALLGVCVKTSITMSSKIRRKEEKQVSFCALLKQVALFNPQNYYRNQLL